MGIRQTQVKLELGAWLGFRKIISVRHFHKFLTSKINKFPVKPASCWLNRNCCQLHAGLVPVPVAGFRKI